MPLSIDATDDEIVIDETPVFNGGQVSNARAANLEQNQAWLLQNFEISTTGRLTTRRGTLNLGSAFGFPVIGVVYYKTPAHTQLIAFSRTGSVYQLKIWSGTTWDDPGGGATGSYALQPMCIAQGGEKLWITQSASPLGYWDGTALTGIGGGSGTSQTIVHPQFVEWHMNRVVLAGGDADPQTVSFSGFLDGTLYDHNNWDLDVGSGDGDAITGIRSWSNNNLVVFKEHSTWLIDCDPAVLQTPDLNVSVFAVNKVHDRIGCVAANTAVQVDSDILFLSDSGVRSLQRTIATELQSQIAPALSDPINDIISRINKSAVKWSSAFYWQSRYILMIPVDNATYPNYAVVFNTLTKSWSGFWTNWQTLCFARRIDADTPKLIMGQASGYVTDFLDYVDETLETDDTYKDVGVGYPSVLETRAFTCGDQDSPKTGLFARTEFKKSKGAVNISAIVDGSDTPTALAPQFNTDASGVKVPLTVPFTLTASSFVPSSVDLMAVGQFREVRIRVGAFANKLSINKASIGAFIDTYKIQE